MLIIEGNKLCTYPRCQNHLTKRCHFYLTMTLLTQFLQEETHERIIRLVNMN